MRTENSKLIRDCKDDDELILYLEKQKRYDNIKKAISLLLKRIITK